jgi:hypothetical protein
MLLCNLIINMANLMGGKTPQDSKGAMAEAARKKKEKGGLFKGLGKALGMGVLGATVAAAGAKVGGDLADRIIPQPKPVAQEQNIHPERHPSVDFKQAEARRALEARQDKDALEIIQDRQAAAARDKVMLQQELKDQERNMIANAGDDVSSPFHNEQHPSMDDRKQQYLSDRADDAKAPGTKIGSYSPHDEPAIKGYQKAQKEGTAMQDVYNSMKAESGVEYDLNGYRAAINAGATSSDFVIMNKKTNKVITAKAFEALVKVSTKNANNFIISQK